MEESALEKTSPVPAEVSPDAAVADGAAPGADAAESAEVGETERPKDIDGESLPNEASAAAEADDEPAAGEMEKAKEADGESLPAATPADAAAEDGAVSGAGDEEAERELTDESDEADEKHPDKVEPVAKSDGKKTARVAVKLLLSNSAVGSVIGKGGANVAEIKKDTRASVKISQAKEHFPGTSDRMVLIAGAIPAALAAVHLVFSKLNKEMAKPEPEQDAEGAETDQETRQIKIAVPGVCCGAIIGKKGATIKKFKRDSKAKIALSPLESNGTGVDERVITVSGSLEQQLRALALIVTKMVEEPSYDAGQTPMSYSMPGAGAAAPAAGRRNRVRSGGSAEKTIEVPDGHVGILVGKGGYGLRQLHQTTGARILVSRREDQAPESGGMRQVTLTGTPKSIASAEKTIQRKLRGVLGSTEEAE